MSRVMFNSELPSVHSGKSPFSDTSLAKSYIHFHDLANQDSPMFFASADDYDIDSGQIYGHWVPWQNEWVPVAENVEINFVFNKLDCFDEKHAHVLRDLRERNICIYGYCELGEFVADKWRCYEEFSDYFALTTRIDEQQDIKQQIENFFTQMDSFYSEHNNAVILKPVSGWQARGIHMVTREQDGKFQLRYLFGQPIDNEQLVEHILQLFLHVPYIMQAYVDTRAGIPEIGLGEVAFHDVRFVFYIKEPGVAQFVQLYLKTPQGMVYYPIENFPSQAFTVIEPIATKIATMFPYGIFSVDVMRDKGGEWYLTELNDQIGFNINWQQTTDIENVTHLMLTFLQDMKRVENAL